MHQRKIINSKGKIDKSSQSLLSMLKRCPGQECLKYKFFHLSDINLYRGLLLQQWMVFIFLNRITDEKAEMSEAHTKKR
ncbi:unnamed protein product [Caretta caretta]